MTDSMTDVDVLGIMLTFTVMPGVTVSSDDMLLWTDETS